MSLPLPSSLSPSKVSTFRDCALAFRLSAIDRLPEPPSIPAVKGTTVHLALELLFGLAPTDRTPEAASETLATALTHMHDHDDFKALELDEPGITAFAADAQKMVHRYFAIEDPRTITPVGLEMMLETELDGITIRGIIDRLEKDPDGSLIVTDYKTGRTPTVNAEQQKLGGVHFYSLLCERVLGQRPKEIRLMYLGTQPEIIVARPTEQSTKGLEKRLGAIWSAIHRACETEDFRPKPGPLCNWCAYKEHCPAFGGTPPTFDAAQARPQARQQARSQPNAQPNQTQQTPQDPPPQRPPLAPELKAHASGADESA